MIALILLCLLAAAFFAGMETGLLSANEVKIYAEREKGRFFARCAYFLLHKPQRLLATTLIGTNLAVITATVLLVLLVRSWAASPSWEWLAVFLLALIILLFAEIIPKSFLRNHADTISLRLAPLLSLFYLLFFPLASILNFLINIFLVLLGQQRRAVGLTRSREDLRALLQLRSRELSFAYHEQKLIDSLFDFPATKAREAMRPLNTVLLADIAMSPKEVAIMAAGQKERFVAIYQGRSDNIVGYIDVKDFLFFERSDLKSYLKEAVFYPETKRLPDLLFTMNEKNRSLVFLCDEYGMISGVLTIDEIITELFGKLGGEEEESAEVKVLSSERFIVAGSASLSEVSRVLGVELEKGDYDTIGGFLCYRLGEIPAKGTVYRDKDVVFKVLKRHRLRLDKIEVIKLKKVEN